MFSDTENSGMNVDIIELNIDKLSSGMYFK